MNTKKYNAWLSAYNQLLPSDKGDQIMKAYALLMLYAGEFKKNGKAFYSSWSSALFGSHRTHENEVKTAVNSAMEQLAKTTLKQAKKEKKTIFFDADITDFVLERSTAQAFADLVKTKIDWSKVDRNGDLWAVAAVLATQCNCVLHEDMNPNKILRTLTT